MDDQKNGSRLWLHQNNTYSIIVFYATMLSMTKSLGVIVPAGTNLKI